MSPPCSSAQGDERKIDGDYGVIVALEFVELSDPEHNRIVAQIQNNTMSVFVGIAGGTGSGKSTLAINLCKRYPAQCAVVHLDDYFKHTKELQMLEGFPNWEHPYSIKFDALYRDPLSLKAGKSISVLTKSKLYNPEYRESLKNRIKYTIEPKKIIILDGYLVLHDQRVNKLLDKKIYLDIPVGVSSKRRGSDKISINHGYFEKVLVPTHKKFVEPTKQYADLVIDVSRKNLEKVYSEVEEFLFNKTTL